MQAARAGSVRPPRVRYRGYAAAAVVGAAAILAGFLWHQRFKAALLENFHSQQATLALSLMNAVRNHVREGVQGLAAAARELEEAPLSPERVRRVIARTREVHADEFLSVALFDADGALVAAVPAGVWTPGIRERAGTAIGQAAGGTTPQLSEGFAAGLGSTGLALCVPLREAGPGGRVLVLAGILRLENYMVSHFPSWRGRRIGVLLVEDGGGILNLLSAAHEGDRAVRKGNVAALGEPCLSCHRAEDFDDVRSAFLSTGVIHARSRVPGRGPANRATVAFSLYNKSWAIAVRSPFGSVQDAIDRNFNAFLALAAMVFLAFAGLAHAGTERMRARFALEMAAAVRESEERFRATFESANDGILVLDPASRILDANRAALALLGRPQGGVAGRLLGEFLGPGAAAVPGELPGGGHEAGGVVFETVFSRPDGSAVAVEVSARGAEYGGARAVLCVARDVTERREAAAALARYAGALERSNELKDLFTDIVRHDLMTPVAIAMGYAELLAERTPDPEAAKLLASLRRGLARLQGLIRSAAELTRLVEAERIDAGPADLAEMLDESLRPLEAAGGWELVRSYPRPCPIVANPVLGDVFLNLVANAAKFSGPSKRLEVAVADAGERWVVSVRDWGPGIADEDKPRVFGRFERAGPRTAQGMGLGLAIVRRVVELHAGSVRVEDNPEGGSVFVVGLPKAGPRGTAA